MAKLFLKHFGIGGRKNPPATPKPDYQSGQKSSSIQDLSGRYQSSEHSCHRLCPGTGSATYDGRSHSRANQASRYLRPFSTHSPITKQKDFLNHSSTSASGDSSPAKEKNPVSSGAASCLPSELGSPQEDKSSGNPTPVSFPYCSHQVTSFKFYCSRLFTHVTFVVFPLILFIIFQHKT